MTVRTVGIRELKAHLSRYLKDVKNGGEIVVSERGKVVARLIPVRDQSEHTRTESVLLRLAAEGKIKLPPISKKPPQPKSRKKVKGSPFSDAVIEDRR